MAEMPSLATNSNNSDMFPTMLTEEEERGSCVFIKYIHLEFNLTFCYLAGALRSCAFVTKHLHSEYFPSI